MAIGPKLPRPSLNSTADSATLQILPVPIASAGMTSITRSRHDGGRCAQHKTDVAVPSVVHSLLHLGLLGEVRPVRDHGHHAVLPDADQDVRLIGDLCAHGSPLITRK